MNKYLIYKATNLKNRKCYIGRTSNELKTRIAYHYSNAKHGNYSFAKALMEYNRDDFKWEIIDIAKNKEESFILEAKYIKEFNSIEYGYNEKEGDKTPWNKGKKMNEAYCERLKGENNPMYGKTHTKEVKEKLSKRMQEVQLGENNHMSRKVYCIELNKTWNTVKECADELGLNKDAISHCCRGKQKTCGGMRFKYMDNKNITINNNMYGENNPSARKVYCIELDRVWDTIKECANDIGVSHTAISKVCRGLSKTSKGMHFKYI